MKEEFQSLNIKQIGITKIFQDTLTDLLSIYNESKRSEYSICQDYKLLMKPDFKHEFLYLYEQHIQKLAQENDTFLNSIYQKIVDECDLSKTNSIPKFENLISQNLNKNAALIMQRHDPYFQKPVEHIRDYSVLSNKEKSKGQIKVINPQKKEILKLINEYVLQLSFN